MCLVCETRIPQTTFGSRKAAWWLAPSFRSLRPLSATNRGQHPQSGTRDQVVEVVVVVINYQRRWWLVVVVVVVVVNFQRW